MIDFPYLQLILIFSVGFDCGGAFSVSYVYSSALFSNRHKMKSQLATTASSRVSTTSSVTAITSSFSLEKHGCCQIEIPLHQQIILAKGFGTAIAAMDSIGDPASKEGSRGDVDAAKQDMHTAASLPILNKNDDAQHATGYHPAGGTLSRYNIFREGFVFSDDNLFDVDDAPEFLEDMLAMRQVLHSLAVTAFNMLGFQMEDFMGLDCSASVSQLEKMLRQNGGEDGRSKYLDGFSQWHVKRYHPPADMLLSPSIATANTEALEPLLGQHTDPSILSVVVHDVPGINAGCIGLEVQNCAKPGDEKGSSAWTELPQHGHGICTILIGGAMARISPPSKFQPCLHRVRGLLDDSSSATIPASHFSRVAATYFFRPAPRTILRPIVVDGSTSDNAEKKRVPRSRRPISFNDWCNKVSRNYGKSKKGSS